MKIPKWIREIECFSKIKSCLILEGNIYDEYPMFNEEKTDCDDFYDLNTYIYEYYKKLTKAQSAPYSGFVNEGTPSLKQKIARFIRGNFFLPDARRGWNKHAYHQAIQIIQEEKQSGQHQEKRQKHPRNGRCKIGL